MFGIIYWCIGLCAITVYPTETSPVLTVHPTYIDVTKDTDVLVKCSFDTDYSARDTVYSVLISRRQTTIAVCFKQAPCEVMIDNVSVENSSVSTLTFLQVRVRNVTCEDRGDYSCKMAVRQAYRNLQLVSSVVDLKVTGKPGRAYFDPPRVIGSNETHTKVVLTCSTLQSDRVSGWRWTVNNHSSPEDSHSCVYSEVDCLYRCSSELRLNVPLGQDHLDTGCSIAGMRARSVLNISRLLEEREEVSDNIGAAPMKIGYPITAEEPHSTVHIYMVAVVLSVFAVFTVSVSVLRISRKSNMCKRIYLKNKEHVKRNSLNTQWNEVQDSNTHLNENETLLMDHEL